MSFVFFVRPIYTPFEFQPMAPPPVVVYPVNNVKFQFPIPVLYSAPPAAVL